MVAGQYSKSYGVFMFRSEFYEYKYGVLRMVTVLPLLFQCKMQHHLLEGCDACAVT